MTASTRKAIIALLAVDETATPEERDRVALALAGGVAVVSVKEAMRRLGCSRQYIWRLVKAGKLDPVRGIGPAGNNRGIAEASVAKYLATTIGRQAS